MVNLTYQAHLKHFVPLSVLQKIAAGGLTDDEREAIHYLTDEMIESIAGMPLLQKGRLSVQVSNCSSAGWFSGKQLLISPTTHSPCQHWRTMRSA